MSRKYNGGYHIVDGYSLGLNGEPIVIDEDWVTVDNFTTNMKVIKQILESCINNKIIMIVNLPIELSSGDIEYLTTYCRTQITEEGQVRVDIPYRYGDDINGIRMYVTKYDDGSYGITGEGFK